MNLKMIITIILYSLILFMFGIFVGKLKENPKNSSQIVIHYVDQKGQEIRPNITANGKLDL